MSESALELESLSYTYTSDWLRKRIPAIQDISLTVREGESFGFLGHNGAGKTTTIKCILGLVRASSGAISICGVDHRAPRARSVVGFVPEQPYFYDHLTVEEALLFYAALKEIPSNERARAVDAALEQVHMTSRRSSRLRALSKGLMQRVAMGQALLGDPRLLILDEPFSGLDPVGRKEFRDLLLSLKRRGTTVFVSSHILTDIEFLCDRASIMVRGELKGVYDLRALPAHEKGGFELALGLDDQPGSGNALLAIREGATATEETAHRLALRFPTREGAERAMRYALAANIPILSFEPIQMHLEDLFVSLLKEGARNG